MKDQEENTAVAVKQPAQLMQVLQNTRPQAIAELEFVREKYVQNYNLANGNKMGDLMYHRNLVHFKSIISGSTALQNCDPFSIYACFVTAAVNGYSFDPEDGQVYIVPRGGKAYIQRQAPAHVQRLLRTRQILFADPVKLVYEGDTFKVSNGVVVIHEENFQSEKIVGGYVRFVLDNNGNAKYFIYRQSDWEAWKAKSPNKTGDTWVYGPLSQPQPAFLRTKILLHACKEKSWSSGSTDPRIEHFAVEIDDDENLNSNGAASTQTPAPTEKVTTNNPDVAAAVINAKADDSEKKPASVNHTDEDEY